MLKFEVGYLGLFDYIFWNVFLKIVFYFLIQKQFLKTSFKKHGQMDPYLHFFFKKKWIFFYFNLFLKIIFKK